MGIQAILPIVDYSLKKLHLYFTFSRRHALEGGRRRPLISPITKNPPGFREDFLRIILLLLQLLQILELVFSRNRSAMLSLQNQPIVKQRT